MGLKASQPRAVHSLRTLPFTSFTKIKPKQGISTCTSLAVTAWGIRKQRGDFAFFRAGKYQYEGEQHLHISLSQEHCPCRRDHQSFMIFFLRWCNTPETPKLWLQHACRPVASDHTSTAWDVGGCCQVCNKDTMNSGNAFWPRCSCSTVTQVITTSMMSGVNTVASCTGTRQTRTGSQRSRYSAKLRKGIAEQRWLENPCTRLEVPPANRLRHVSMSKVARTTKASLARKAFPPAVQSCSSSAPYFCKALDS